MKKKTQVTMTRLDFLAMMLTMTHRHMAALKANTEIDRTQMKGGKSTAAKYGGYVTKMARITWNHSIDYLEAVKAKLEKFGLNPDAFIASEHRFIRRALYNGKLTTMGYHKDDVNLPINERRWYLIAYVMNGCVKSLYDYTDANGNKVDKDALHADLYDVVSKKQAEAGLDTIDKQVMYRNYSLENVLQVHMEGMKITLI